MKKLYSKPEIAFESFTLSTNVAGDCNKIIDAQSKGSCGIPGSAPNMALFVQGVTGCQVWDDDGKDDDGYCYHVPDGVPVLFNS